MCVILIGMTKVKVGKEDPSSAEFVERRRAALERFVTQDDIGSYLGALK